jgi:hypothetical protein
MILFGILQLALGTVLTIVCRHEIVGGLASYRWPRTTGKISNSTIHEGVSLGTTTDGTMSPTNRHYREIGYVYEYYVSGKCYQSSRFDFSAVGWTDSTHYINDEVIVYYCPKDPSVSVLRAGISLEIAVWPLLSASGLVFILASL